MFALQKIFSLLRFHWIAVESSLFDRDALWEVANGPTRKDHVAVLVENADKHTYVILPLGHSPTHEIDYQ
jgi:hypothetical protein